MATSRKYKIASPKAPLKVEERKVAYSTGKQRLNLTVRADLIERARAAKLNLSSVVEQSLERTLRETERERWLAENAEALAFHRARVERDGPLCADLVSL